jgi:hypothetical protein
MGLGLCLLATLMNGNREMIFVHLNLDNFLDNSLSYSHYVFTLSLHPFFYCFCYIKEEETKICLKLSNTNSCTYITTHGNIC